MNAFSAIRDELGITQKEAAHIAGTAVRTYTMWEHQMNLEQLTPYQVFAYSNLFQEKRKDAIFKYSESVAGYQKGLYAGYYIPPEFSVSWGAGMPTYKVPLLAPAVFCSVMWGALTDTIDLLKGGEKKAAIKKLEGIIEFLKEDEE